MTFETAPTDQEPHDHQATAGHSEARRRLRLIGIAIVVIAATAVLSWVTRTSTTTAVPVNGDISRVELDVAAGNIEIVGRAGAEVEYTSRTDDGWVRAAQVTHRVDDGILYIEGDCRGNRFVPAFGCHTHVTVTVPHGVEVVASASGGSIEARGLSAAAHLESKAGRVVVDDHTGSLRAHSAAGDVVVTNLASHEAHVTSSAGGVRVEALIPPRSLDAESSAGPVAVVVPADVAYHVEARTQVGGTTVDVPTNYSSVHEVRAFSSAGAVVVTSP